jgi:hypothetical protein
MKTNLFYLITGMLALCLNLQAQRYCGSVINLTELQQTNPVRYQKIMDLENLTQARINGINSIPDSIIIPVVVHVVYYNLLLSAKLKNRTNHLSEMPIKQHFGFVFEKVSPPTQNG